MIFFSLFPKLLFIYMLYKIEDKQQTYPITHPFSPSSLHLPSINSKSSHHAHSLNNLGQAINHAGHHKIYHKNQSQQNPKADKFFYFPQNKKIVTYIIPYEQQENSVKHETNKNQLRKYRSEQKINCKEIKLNLEGREEKKKKIQNESMMENYRVALDKRKLSQNYETVDLWKLRHHSQKLRSMDFLKITRNDKNTQSNPKLKESIASIQPDFQPQTKIIHENSTNLKNLFISKRNSLGKKQQQNHPKAKNSPNIKSIEIQTNVPQEVRIEKVGYNNTKKKTKMMELRQMNSRELVSHYESSSPKKKVRNPKKKKELDKIKQSLKMMEKQSLNEEQPSKWHTNNMDNLEEEELNWEQILKKEKNPQIKQFYANSSQIRMRLLEDLKMKFSSQY